MNAVKDWRLSNFDARELIVLLDKITSSKGASELYEVDDQIIYPRAFAMLVDNNKRGEFNTPRSVRQLMVRLAAPRPGHSVYDPCAGSGGLLLSADDYVADRTGRHDLLTLFGQDVNVQVCTLARLNLMLHGITNASIRVGDAITDPSYFNSTGVLQRFNRVLTDPPFGLKSREELQNILAQTRYGRSHLADFMFVQHVLASLSPNGIGIVTIPNGALFRGGIEGKIRQGIVQDGRIASVIAIGRNVFNRTSVPFSLLVLRGEELARDSDCDILFINADQEVEVTRSLTQLAPRHVEKIANTFHERREIGHFSRLVSLEEITDNKFDLNVANYVELQLTAHPHLSIAALLAGGVPIGEVETQRDRFTAFNIDVADLFVSGKPGYFKFPVDGYETIAATIPMQAAPTESAYARTVKKWFEDFRSKQSVLTNRSLVAASRHFANGFRKTLATSTILNAEQLTGIFVDWWGTNQEDLNLLRELAIRTNAPAPDIADPLFDRIGTDLVGRATKLVAQQRNQLVDIYLAWGNQYSTSLAHLEHQREQASSRLATQLRKLGYQWPLGV